MTAQTRTTSKSTLKTEDPVEVLPVRQMKVLLTWKAPVRVFKKRNREFWTTVLAIFVLLAIILVFIKEWMLLAAIISLVFVYYVLSSVPPEEVEHQITTRGVHFSGKEYFWEEFLRYWISERWGQKILNLELRTGLPRRIELLLGSQEVKKVKEILDKYLLAETPRPTFLDKASAWLSKNVPLEAS